MVQIGRSTELITFLVTDRFATFVILRCDFCDRHVEANKLRLTIVEMDDRSTVPIVRKLTKANENVRIPEEKQFFSKKNRSLLKSKTSKLVWFKTETQTWIEVNSKPDGSILVDPYRLLYAKTICFLPVVV